MDGNGSDTHPDKKKKCYDKIELLCRDAKSISAGYAESPDCSPGELAEQHFRSHHLRNPSTQTPSHRSHPSPADLEWARRCGDFGTTQPSELFLHAFHDLLQCLHTDPMANCVSPPLCGSTGSVPMTIIAPLNDQLRHMSNVIVRARKEVLLATNFWKNSGASHFINDAMVELSRRAGERGERIVFKLIFDRGDVRQVWDNHQNIPSSGWQASGVGLPAPKDISHIDLSIVNFHKPPLGTFHCKFMIVDRQIATVSSHNVQDIDNLEMMSHLEGPIVDSLWETFLVSWNNKLEPPLPCRLETAKSKPAPSYEEESFKNLFDMNGAFRKPEQPMDEHFPEHMSGGPHYDDSVAGEIQRMRSTLTPKNGESHAETVARHLNAPTGLSVEATGPSREPDLHFFPFIPVPPGGPYPMAMASRKPYSSMNNESVFVPQNEAFLSLIRNAKRTIFIQTPDLNSKTLLPALIEACKRGVEITYYVCLGYNDAGEMLPGQGGTNEQAINYLNSQLDESERQRLKTFFYVAADQDHPIHNSFKQRSCHIKLMIADESVAIQGSGNQDTQSWYHSQEVNVMIDSPTVCKAWREGIERNQNTALFGCASLDGYWRDKDGNIAPGSNVGGGPLTWAKGMFSMLSKAQGK